VGLQVHLLALQLRILKKGGASENSIHRLFRPRAHTPRTFTPAMEAAAKLAKPHDVGV
jgi:hypothetical protein